MRVCTYYVCMYDQDATKILLVNFWSILRDVVNFCNNNILPAYLYLGSDVFSTSTDGEVLWWDIRKLVEPVETLKLEFAGYMPGQKLGGIVMEYESTMVRFINSYSP